MAAYLRGLAKGVLFYKDAVLFRGPERDPNLKNYPV